MKDQRPKTKDQKYGFTLIEVLVASSVLLIIVASVFSLLRVGLNYIEQSRELTKATYILEGKMEEIRSMPFSSLPSLHGTTFENGKGRIYVTPVKSDLVQIKAELIWNPKRKPLEIYTLRSAY